jgi:hypothetical protein
LFCERQAVHDREADYDDREADYDDREAVNDGQGLQAVHDGEAVHDREAIHNRHDDNDGQDIDVR